MRENKTIMSWEQVITAEQWQEELTWQQNRSHEPASYTPVNNKWFTSKRHVTTYIKNYKDLTNSVNWFLSSIFTNYLSFNVFRNHFSSYKNKNKKPASQDSVKYYNYQKIGHILNNCSTSKTSEDKVKKEKA